ncbi:MAG: hypothetical protein EXS31_15140 [Pedosphaera sp.]|nr:hypothetical protein [Pedosphaera sp.]
MPESLQTCPQCGNALPGKDSRGLCPSCLMQACLNPEGVKTEDATSLDVAWLEKFNLQTSPASTDGAGSFGDYELLEEIARGGMGIVYKARQKNLNRLVAVKMILAGQFAGKQVTQRFRGEAAAAGTLHHPNIVAIHEIGMHEGRHFFSMDYVEGQNLARLVGTQPLPARKAAHYVKLIAEAIHYAHQQGILHRDLKPSNVMIDSATDQPRVTDFGLAKRLDGESSVTVTGQLLGSPSFMPPEQASAQRGKVGRHSDVYGLGAILFYTLTARAPFQGATLETIIHEVLNTEPLSPRAFNPSVPLDLETICLKCLEKEPAKRYATAQELADELGRFLKDEPIHARPVTRAERVWRWCRRKPAVASLAAATALGVILIAVISTTAAVRLEISRRATERENYAASISQADQLIRDSESDRAIDLLLKCSPELRHWEWGHLMYLCHQDVLTIPAHTNVTTDLLRAEPTVPMIAFDAEGIQLVSLGAEGLAKVWAVEDGRNLMAFGGPTNRVLSVAFNPKENQLALGCTNGVVRMWNTMSWRELPALAVGNRSAEFIPLPAGENTAKRNEFRAPLPSVTLLAYSPDGKKLAAAASDNSVTVWDISSRQELFHIDRLADAIQALFFTTDGQRLVTKEELIARIWDAQTGRSLSTFNVATDEYRAVFVHPNGDRFVTIDGRDHVKLWSSTNSVRQLGVTRGSQPGNYRRVFFSSDGRLVCMAGDRATAKVCNAETGEEVMTLPGRVHTAMFSPDGRFLVTLDAERIAKVWDVAASQNTLTLQGHQSLVQTVTFSPDGRLIATADNNGVVKVWSASTGREVFQGSNWNWAPAFSPDGQRVTMCSWWDNFKVWDTQSGQEILTLKSRIHSAGAGSVFSPDGKWIVTASNEKMARIWDAHTGQQLRELRGHTRAVCDVAYSTNGQRIATASLDGTVRLWEAETGRELHVLKGHTNSQVSGY